MNTDKLAETLTKLGSDAVQDSIAEYTRWYAVDAACWIAFGTLLFIVGAFFVAKFERFRRRLMEKKDWETLTVNFVIQGVALTVAVVGLAVVLRNVPTALNPRAYAIHQLINDARGE